MERWFPLETKALICCTLYLLCLSRPWRDSVPCALYLPRSISGPCALCLLCSVPVSPVARLCASCALYDTGFLKISIVYSSKQFCVFLFNGVHV
jgi:hypothetical protein